MRNQSGTTQRPFCSRAVMTCIEAGALDPIKHWSGFESPFPSSASDAHTLQYDTVALDEGPSRHIPVLCGGVF